MEKEANRQNQVECPEGCCQGNELLCLSIPCPVTIVLLGFELNVELPCLRISTDQAMTSDQASQLLQTLSAMVGNLGVMVTSEAMGQDAD